MKSILINCLVRNNGGPALSLEIAKALKKNGNKVFAVISRYSLNYADWINAGLDEIIDINTYHGMKDILPATCSFILRDRKRLQLKLNSLGIDYVLNTFLHPWAIMVSSLVENAIVLSICHDPQNHSGTSIVEKLLQKNFIKRSNDIIVLSKKFISVVNENYHIPMSNIHYCYHGSYNVYKEKQKIPSDLPLDYSKDKVNFMFFGRVEVYKGIDVLVDAYCSLKDRFNNISLTIIGKGTLNISNKIDLKKYGINIINQYIADEEVGNCFTGPNLVVVLPYLDATQSGVIPIAIQYGLPIIASDTGALREQLFDGEIGSFVKSGDARQLSICMERYVKDTNLIEQEGHIIKEKSYLLEWENILKELFEEINEKYR